MGKIKEKILFALKIVGSVIWSAFKWVGSEIIKLLKKVYAKIKKAFHDRKVYGKPVWIEYPVYLVYNALKGFILGFKEGHVNYVTKKIIALNREKNANRPSREEA